MNNTNTYPPLKNDVELLKITTNDFELKNLTKRLDEKDKKDIFEKQYHQYELIYNEFEKEKKI